MRAFLLLMLVGLAAAAEINVAADATVGAQAQGEHQGGLSAKFNAMKESLMNKFHGGVDAIKVKFDKMKDDLKKKLQGLKEKLAPAVEEMKNKFSDLKDKLEKLDAKFVEMMKNGNMDVNVIEKGVNEIVAKLKEKKNPIADKFAKQLEEGLATLKKYMQEHQQGCNKTAGSATVNAEVNAEVKAQAKRDLFQQIKDKVHGGVNAIKTKLCKDKLKRELKGLKDGLAGEVEKTKKQFPDVATELTELDAKFVDMMNKGNMDVNVIEKGVNEIAGKLEKMDDKDAKKFAQDFKGGLNLLKKYMDENKECLKKAGNAEVKAEAKRDLLQSIKDKFHGGVNAIKAKLCKDKLKRELKGLQAGLAGEVNNMKTKFPDFKEELETLDAKFTEMTNKGNMNYEEIEQGVNKIVVGFEKKEDKDATKYAEELKGGLGQVKKYLDENKECLKKAGNA